MKTDSTSAVKTIRLNGFAEINFLSPRVRTDQTNTTYNEMSGTV